LQPKTEAEIEAQIEAEGAAEEQREAEEQAEAEAILDGPPPDLAPAEPVLPDPDRYARDRFTTLILELKKLVMKSSDRFAACGTCSRSRFMARHMRTQILICKSSGRLPSLVHEDSLLGFPLSFPCEEVGEAPAARRSRAAEPDWLRKGKLCGGHLSVNPHGATAIAFLDLADGQKGGIIRNVDAMLES